MTRAHLCFLIAVAGCDLTEPVETSTEVDAILTCQNTPFLCNNSGGYLHGGMHELSLLGWPNAQNLRLRSASGRPVIRKAGVDYRLDIVEGEVQLLSASTGAIVYRGAGAVDSELNVVDVNNMPAFDIIVTSYRLSAYQIGVKSALHLYVMKWRPPGYDKPKDNACNPYTFPQTHDFLGMVDGEVMMFAGDRFYPDHFNVEPSPAAAAGWITFGCAGHALAKLDLSGNTRHRHMDWAGSQATLKLYAADYCGIGRAFTHPGTPLVWRGPTTQYAALPAPGDLEARWNAYGATCLQTPRLVAHGETLDPLPCTIPVCTNTNVNDLAGATRISANYFP